jgi:uncharacterized membrane protein (UPF0136 family)
LALDAFIDHLLTGGFSLTASDASLSHMNSTEPHPVHNTLFGYPMPVDLFSALYAGAVATGGIVGFVKAGSKPSLAAGLLFGGLLGYGTFLTSVNPDDYYLTLGNFLSEHFICLFVNCGILMMNFSAESHRNIVRTGRSDGCSLLQERQVHASRNRVRLQLGHGDSLLLSNAFHSEQF